jgi:hypothetical protein
MDLSTMLDWLTTTRAFAAASPGPGGGKEQLFQVAVREYRTIGTQLFLQHEPDIAQKHEAALVDTRVKRLPLDQQPAMRLKLGGEYARGRQQVRGQLGLPALAIGGNAP